MAVAKVRAFLNVRPLMGALDISSPLVFAPLFMERIWGGRRLETLYGKSLPADRSIGESWEIVDRPEAQSVIISGPLQGHTLHHLWTTRRAEIFGKVPDAPRFPLFVKLLDARETLSLQVHPPAEIAAELGGEPKTEFWYIADATAEAEIILGLTKPTTRDQFAEAVRAGQAAELVHRFPSRTGEGILLPSGRLHAVGGGNLIVEVQQNSDTTYRVFDWNRLDDSGTPRKLHIEESLRSITFDDVRPTSQPADGESLVRHELFEIEKWQLTAAREVAPRGRFAIIGCLSGEVACAGVCAKAGEFFLVPASLADRVLCPQAERTSLLRIGIPA
ncbi:MAG: type I phosphomannose isomerase catalytic subunit [Chthoniobacterales bacterium]